MWQGYIPLDILDFFGWYMLISPFTFAMEGWRTAYGLFSHTQPCRVQHSTTRIDNRLYKRKTDFASKVLPAGIALPNSVWTDMWVNHNSLFCIRINMIWHITIQKRVICQMIISNARLYYCVVYYNILHCMLRENLRPWAVSSPCSSCYSC